jgi:hypothetical protein
MSTKTEFCSTEHRIFSTEMRQASPHASCALLAALVCTGFTAVAQKPGELDRIVEFSTAFDQAQSKFIHEGVTDQDPGAMVWIDQAAQSVGMRVHIELDRDQLQAVVGQAGLQITYLGPPRHEVGAVRAAASGGGAAPVYIDTGDPATDNARYEVAKKTWIAAHPDLYQQQAVQPER